MNAIDLEKLENKVQQPDGSFVCFCPACGEEGRNLKSKNHLRVWPDLRFNCVVNTGDKSHNAKILQLVGTESINSDYVYQPQAPKIETTKSWPIEILNRLIPDYSYFKSRGISEETQIFFRIGFASTGQLNQRAVIPIFNESKSSIIGWTGRLVNYTDWHKQNKIPKWKHLNHIQSKAVWPYLPKEIRSAKTIILVESPGCTLYLHERGIKNSVCLFGVNIGSKVLSYLISMNPDRILISTNNELDSQNKGVGNRAASKIKEKLDQLFDPDKVLIALPEFKDFGEYYNKDEKSLDKWAEKWLNNEIYHE